MSQTLILNKKGLILQFIEEKQRTTKELMMKFGNYGSTRTLLQQLESDKLIRRPSKGVWEKYD